MSTKTKAILIGVGTLIVGIVVVPYTIQLGGEKNPFVAGQKALWPVMALAVGAALVAHKQLKKREKVESPPLAGSAAESNRVSKNA